MTDDHTLGEIVRRLDEVSRRLDDVSTRLERRQSQMEQAYVRKDVYAADQQADGIQARGFEAELHSVNTRMTRTEDQRRVDRNLLLASLAFPLLLLMIGALVTSGSLG